MTFVKNLLQIGFMLYKNIQQFYFSLKLYEGISSTSDPDLYFLQ